jgi:hypothetical protein
VKTRLSIRILLFSLATLVLFNGMGIYVLSFAQTEIHRISREINKGELEKLVMNGDEFSSVAWIGKNDFIYKDQVYDCESMNSSNGKITISCYPDIKETTLKNVLGESFEKPFASPHQKTTKEAFKFFPVFPINENISIAYYNSSNTDFQYQNGNNAFSAPDRDIASPPPDKA